LQFTRDPMARLISRSWACGSLCPAGGFRV